MRVNKPAIVATVSRLLEEPERSSRVTVPWVVGVQVIVVAVPAWIVPPIGAEMGLGEDCATARAAKAETKSARSFMFVDAEASAQQWVEGRKNDKKESLEKRESRSYDKSR